MNEPKFGLLVYPDYLQKWFDFGHGLLIFPRLAQFWLNEMSPSVWEVSVHFMEKA